MSKRSEGARGDAGGAGNKGDTAELPRIPSASLEQIPGSDPYNNSVPAPTIPVLGDTRRGLYDVPELGTRKPASDLALRLAAMRVELERVLADMENQRGLAVDSADQKALGLIQKLRESARHLEDAIDSLLPPDEP